ncbi:GNAT domain-containing protein [Aspergillus bertholletiae]|uniref:GNAT domain-containing protein n=1 Tax=Aspergillus bertholletiae TaxID=1226010 RepID=A0A5N7ATD5_9EURO|nr:GNAT domain-containing protein [Aspergillus bertholletiae]
MLSLQTSRLDIRPLVLSDAEDIFEMRRNPEIAKWGMAGKADTSISQTIDWMLSSLLSAESPKNATTTDTTTATTTTPEKPAPKVLFAIRELQPGTVIPEPKVIGTMGIKRSAAPSCPTGSNRVRWELGYGFHTGVWGKGYATEAAKGVMGQFKEIKRTLEGNGEGNDAVGVAEGLWAATAENNLASQAVLRKCGFEFVGKFVDELGRKNLDFQVLV